MSEVIAYIVAMVEHGNWTSISMANGNTFTVKESIKDICSKFPKYVSQICHVDMT